MAKEIVITIDSREVRCPEGASVLVAADGAGIYLPRLCFHPDLPPGPGTKANGRIYRSGELIAAGGTDDPLYHGCNLCVVEIEGRGPSPACATLAQEGMVVHSDTAEVKELRRANLARIMALHPHACLSCSERFGCDRGSCTGGVIKNARCCPKFDNCEFQRLSEYVTVKNDVVQYAFRDLPIAETPFFTLDPNLCIGCARCVRACEKVSGKRAMGFSLRNGEFIIGTVEASHRESGCVFCGACVAVCPTGALVAKGVPWKKKDALRFASVKLPPEDYRALTDENIDAAPQASGVYQLIDERGTILYIKGADDIRQDLREMAKTVDKARFFTFELHGMFSMRENEMLQKFLNKHGKLPEVNNEIADLY
jgi:predicted molibdopterin-dependent oxidoreductase YjgC